MMLLVGIVLLEMIKSGGYAGDAEEEEKEVHACLLSLGVCHGGRPYSFTLS